MKTNSNNFLVFLPCLISWFSVISLYFSAGLYYSSTCWSFSPFTIFLSFIPLIFFSFFFTSISNLSYFRSSMLVISMICSIICFNINNSILFWVFYELSILPLLLLLYIDSPYSERFLAIWYLLGYIMVTSLPMLWIVYYLSLANNSFCISEWDSSSGYLSYFLFILFITKIPLPPFHSWLPVVHAEANSFVSIMLSGYIMKLGLIGVFRFGSVLFENLFLYIGIILIFSLFFFLNSFIELDSKRWLAFLSLSHILICLVSMYCEPWLGVSVGSLYCLGHGISAGLLFYLFLFLYEGSGSRNWLVLGEINNSSLILRVISIVSLVTLASFPPSIQFLSEVNILLESFICSAIVLPYSIYLFLGGLVPVLLISYFISRSSSLSNIFVYYFSFTTQLILCISCFIWGTLI
uniref:NADH-ubiquinone oxidoreductase chain 4 n=1 Tax=Capsala pricei TaxID=651779 RepID=A0A6G7WDY4_9PLAT|nr:NADH dehydrogenase subunit 4 [Capsala pricei]QIK50410.1 NADH dehydrogenase subunit 4 [Capsala pricei]